jgi:hypothetical protein
MTFVEWEEGTFRDFRTSSGRRSLGLGGPLFLKYKFCRILEKKYGLKTILREMEI